MRKKICLLGFAGFFSFASADSASFNIDKMSADTLNSFGVGVEFLPSLKRNAILDAKWEFFVDQFDSSYEFIPIIRSMIIQAGIPQEFLFLAMAESGFSARAYSKKRAVGIWQFMPFTARDMGLRIDEYVDERRDPIKSTRAAIKYLQFLYRSTGEWYLAAMAYNCGLGRVKKAIQRAGSKELQVLLDDKKKYLPRETRSYIRTILSMSLAFNSVQKLQDVNREYLLNRGAMDTLSEVQIKGGTPLANVAVSVGMSLEDLKKYNRHLTYNFIPPQSKTYPVYIPYEKLAQFKQKFDPDATPKSVFMVHKVKKGESLATIAKKYNITIHELKVTNNLSQKPTIFANQKLVIPVIRKNKQKANN